MVRYRAAQLQVKHTTAKLYFMQGAVQVFIMALEDATKSLIDNIFIELTLDVTGPLTQMQTYNGANGVAMVEMRFDAKCAVGFVGSDCTTCADGFNGPNCMCMDTDDATGHYTCNQDGSIICLTGYQDETTDCTTCVPADGCCKFNILSLGLLLYILHHALQLQLEDTVKHLESVSAILDMKGKPAVM